MKKLIALIACISVFACMSVSALAAAPTGSIEDISYTEATESASGYFTIDASDVATGNTQTTIVVIDGVGTADENGVKNYNISTSTIQYINQQDTASFTVIPKDHDTYLEGATEKTLTVLIGGDNINRTELGTITYAAAGGGEGGEDTYTTNVKENVFGVDGSKIIRFYGLGSGKVVTVDGVQAKCYTNPATEEVVYIAAITANENEPVVSITDGTSETILFGDINDDESVNTRDVNFLTFKTNDMTITDRSGTVVYSLPTDLMELVGYDINGDGSVNTRDVNFLTFATNNMTITDRTGTVTYSLETLAPLLVEASE